MSEKKKFGPAEVAAAIGVKRATLHSWMARRYIEIESQGRGVAREFSLAQVVCLGAMAAMTRRGFDIGAAVEIWHSVKEDFLAAARYRQGHGSVLLVDGEHARIGNAETIQGWLASLSNPAADRSRPVDAYILMLGPLIEQLRNALAYDGP